ncbi:MAG: YraN family protein [Planctomycetes bacterium]|nr:YraN family protein [Planctomycetota bacterium]
MWSLLVGRKRLLSDPRRLGRWGESRCAAYLKRKGYKTITRNYSCARGEIDLIMADDNAIVFVEVKTRRNEDHSRAQYAVTRKKQAKMLRTARYFLKNYKIKDRPLRFDVVAIILGEKGPPEIRHYKNAFVPPGRG